MKSLMPLLAAALLFVGCEKIEGQLNVTNDVKLISTKGATRTIRVGTYSADIKANTSKKITLRLNNDSDEKFVFNLPDGSRIPANGTFSFKSHEVGQPVDISGSVATTTQNSPVRQTTEQCTYWEPVQVCTPLPNGGMSCTVQNRQVFGMRWIEYYDRRTDKDLALSISAANAGSESAQFQGDVAFIERITLRATQCR